MLNAAQQSELDLILSKAANYLSHVSIPISVGTLRALATQNQELEDRMTELRLCIASNPYYNY